MRIRKGGICGFRKNVQIFYLSSLAVILQRRLLLLLPNLDRHRKRRKQTKIKLRRRSSQHDYIGRGKNIIFNHFFVFFIVFSV
ncbi:hypothetical protein B9Z55_021374 [Caenorhabditis nigoni]|uniref:Uncharacterized protein n=1 Tax=Caenorhabditis nigoni TaxID=1611254 RepID=A0A2G5TSL8_9PELO|nr:hypothetical protein B9Z55_021374 [Caenorhabditis nigoni]